MTGADVTSIRTMQTGVPRHGVSCCCVVAEQRGASLKPLPDIACTVQSFDDRSDVFA